MVISSPLQSKVPVSSSKTIKKFQTILFNRTRVRRETFQKKTILQSRRIENERRKQREDELEAPNLVTKPRGPVRLIAGSAKGFFERLMGFLSYLTAGWIINNIPTWIAMGNEFIARTQKMGKILGNFVGNITNVLTNFTKLMGASLENLIKFDFSDTSGRVSTAFDDLNLSVKNWGTDFENAIKLITTPLSEGIASGQDAPSTGTQITDEGAYERTAPYGGGGGFSGSGVAKGTQIAKRLQKDLGLKDYQAAAVVGNLLQENTNLVPDLLEGSKKGLLPEAMRKGIGYGWAQWTYPGRQRELYQLAQSMGVDPSKQPLTDEINYAMLVKELPRYDSGGRFRNSKTIEEASNWILFQYENPADKGSREQGERISDSRKILQSLKASPAPQQSSTPPQPQITQRIGVTTTVRDEINISGPSGGTSSVGLSREEGAQYLAGRGGGRKHAGIDIGTSGQRGYYVSFKQSGKVTYARNNGKGYGNLVIIKSGNIEFYFAHLATILVKEGQQYNGETIGEIGKTGGDYPIHLHFEARPNGNPINPKPYLNLLSIGRQLTGISGKTMAIPTQTSSPSLAQITPTRTSQNSQISQSLAQERTGPTVIVSQNPEPVQQMMYSGGGGYSGGGSSQISEFTLLNNFIKNKLLLDLAYL
jgi:murein DD-endopeptidase MepM/ murein hydrolase activator NlpD